MGHGKGQMRNSNHNTANNSAIVSPARFLFYTERSIIIRLLNLSDAWNYKEILWNWDSSCP